MATRYFPKLLFFSKTFRSLISGSNPCLPGSRSHEHTAEMPKAFQTLILYVSGGECERRGIWVQLGGNSYSISAMSDVHHRYS
jgi:hypothetical protein